MDSEEMEKTKTATENLTETTVTDDTAMTTDGTASTTDSGESIPGFGVSATLVALVGAALLVVPATTDR